MEIFRSIFILLVLHFINLSESISIDCTYTHHHYDVMGSIYQCNIESSFAITSRETATIVSATGGHKHLNNNNDVYGFVADYKTLKYFPQGLEKIFKNLQLLRVRFSSILEITQSDLKPFSQLKELDLHENKITILEDGLFDYNPKLVFVSFSSNKIFRIGSKVFDNLSSLRYLYLSANECIDSFANNNREIVEMLVTKATSQCNLTELSPELSSIKPDAMIQKLNEISSEYEEDPDFDEDIPSLTNYRTSGKSSSSLQIMFIIIFIVAIAAAGGVFYFISAFQYRF